VPVCGNFDVIDVMQGLNYAYQCNGKR